MFARLPEGCLYFADRNAAPERALMSFIKEGIGLIAVITPAASREGGHLFVPDETSDEGACWLYRVGADGFEYGTLADLLAPEEAA